MITRLITLVLCVAFGSISVAQLNISQSAFVAAVLKPASSASSTLNDSLVSYWKLDEASGTRTDSETTGTAQNLTDNNTVGVGTGKIGDCATFANANQESLSRSDSAEMSTGDIDFTFAAWVKPSATNVAQSVLSKTDSATGDEYGIDISQGVFRFYIANGGTYRIATNFTQITAGQWTMVVCWHDSSANTVNISVNNGSEASLTTGGTAPDGGGASYRVGAYRTSAGAYWTGDIDEIGFWKKVLSASEKTELYNSGSGKTCCPF